MYTYLITGATSDIGLELIKTVAKNGDRFILRGFGGSEKIEGFCRENHIDFDYERFVVEERKKKEQEEYENAMSSIEGTWRWNNFFGYYMELYDGKISYGSNVDHSVNSASEFWYDNFGTYSYDINSKSYTLEFIWGKKMTYNGKNIRIYDEYGDPASFFDGYASRIK